MNDDKKLEKARERVRKIKGFYSNILTFILVNCLLLIINLISDRHNLWFYWVTLIWGFILLVQAINLFTIRDKFLGDEWEEKKVRELLDREEKQGDTHSKKF